MNWTLIKKDLRLMRPVTIGAVILAVVFYITLPSMAAYEMFKFVDDPTWGDWTLGSKLKHARGNMTAAFSTACVVVNGCLLLWAAAIGGMSFAHERRERWADLLGTLPITLEQWIGTKFASFLIWAGTYVLGNVLLYAANATVRAAFLGGSWDNFSTGQLHRWEGVPLKEFIESTLTIGGYALALFGMAWLVSSMIRSAVIAASVPIGLVLVTFVLMATFSSRSPLRGIPNEVQEIVLKFVLPLTIAAVTIPIGVAIQRLRATP